MSKLNIVSNITKTDEHALNVVPCDFEVIWNASHTNRMPLLHLRLWKIADFHFHVVFTLSDDDKSPQSSANYWRSPDGEWVSDHQRLDSSLQEKLEQAYLNWLAEKALTS